MNKAIIYAFGVVTGLILSSIITKSYIKGVRVMYDAMSEKEKESSKVEES